MRNHNRQSFLMSTAPASADHGGRAYVFLGLPAGTYRIEVITPSRLQRAGLRGAGYSQHKTPRVEYWSILLDSREAALQELRWLNTLGVAGELPEATAETQQHAAENGNAAVNAVHVYTEGRR